MTDERRYTLAEARVELTREECGRYGHSYDIKVHVGSNEPRDVLCSRCGLTWAIASDHNERNT